MGDAIGGLLAWADSLLLQVSLVFYHDAAMCQSDVSHSMLLDLRIMALPVHRHVAGGCVRYQSRWWDYSENPKYHESSIYPIYRTSPYTYSIHSASPTNNFLHPMVSSAAESRFTRTSLSQIQFVCTISHQTQAMPVSSFVPASQPSQINSKRKERKNRRQPPPAAQTVLVSQQSLL